VRFLLSSRGLSKKKTPRVKRINMLSKHEMMRLAWYVLNVPEEKAQRKLDALELEDASAVIILSSVYHGIHLEDIANSEEPQRKIGFSMGKEKDEGEKEDVSED